MHRLKLKPRIKAKQGGSYFVTGYYDTDIMQRPATGIGKTPLDCWESFLENLAGAMRPIPRKRVIPTVEHCCSLMAV